MRHLTLLCALLASTPALAAAPAPATQQEAVLERVVLVARHGIRSPTKAPQVLQSQTGHVWAQWPVAPGELTEHGKQALELMVGMVRQHYVQAGLLPAADCPPPGSITIWADAKDHRTRESGDVWAKHLAPSCKLQSLSLVAAQEDPIFAGPTTPLSIQEQNAITREFNQRYSTIPATVAHSMNALQVVLAPTACSIDKPHCLRTNTAMLVWKKDKPHLEGGIATGGTAAENLLLEYAQGMPVHAEPFGQQNPAALIELVFPLHTQESWLIRRLPTLAAYKGAPMASVVQDVLAGKPNPALPAVTEQTKLLVLSGHDTNLDVLATLYGLDWSFTDQPDPTAPDTTLAFELWRSPSGSYVSVRLFHQGLESLRTLTPPDLAMDMQVITKDLSLQKLQPTGDR